MTPALSASLAPGRSVKRLLSYVLAAVAAVFLFAVIVVGGLVMAAFLAVGSIAYALRG